MMRRLMTLGLLGCLLCLVVLPAASAEMRGLWVDAFHPGFKSPAQTSEMISKAKECNFNALFVQVRKRGDVYYRSSIEPMAKDVAPGYDPLSDIVTKAHAAGLQVHAWISVYEVFHVNKWVTAGPSQVHLFHPEWLMKDDRGRTKFPGDKYYLDPGLPQVREYLLGMVKEIADNYEVDGIHLDIVRYPCQSGGYNDLSVAQFIRDGKAKDKPKADDAVWSDWRRSQVTEFVRLTKQELKQNERPIKLSAAVFSNRTDSYYNRLQDWVGWLKTGLLDFAVPMVFPKDNRTFQTVLADVVSASKGKTIYIGQGGWRLGAAQSVQQIEMIRDAGAPGVVVYSYFYTCKPRSQKTESLMDTLKTSLFSEAEKEQ